MFRKLLSRRLFSRCFSAAVVKKSTPPKPFGGQIQYISDIHLDKNPFNQYQVKPDPGARALVIAGDLGSPFSPHFESFFRYNSDNFGEVLFVPGNHEYYYDPDLAEDPNLTSFDQNNLGTYSGTNSQLLKVTGQFKNVKVLNRDSHTLHLTDQNGQPETVTVLGCTLWSDIPAQYHSIMSKKCPDYHKISMGDSLLTPRITNLLHHQEITWLFQELQTLKHMTDRRVLVVTHHAPLILGTCHPKYLCQDPKTREMDRVKWGNYAFSTDLERMLGKPIAAWIFGHTHYRACFQHKSGTVLAQNNLGYVKKPYQSIRTL